MPVPASYNDLVTDPAEREHVGDVWYQRDVWVPASWEGRRIVLRCDAATHRGTVWAGDTQVADHAGGYTPFEADVTALARCGEPLRVTVRVGNELTMATIPPGVISVSAGGQRTQRYFHDFFNYAGLHRSVWLYATPEDLHRRHHGQHRPQDAGTGEVRYHVDVRGRGRVRGGADVGGAAGRGRAAGRAAPPVPTAPCGVPAARPWQPGDPYLYRLDVTHGPDEYCLPVGIRTVRAEAGRLLLNGAPVRLRGFGMHEDGTTRARATTTRGWSATSRCWTGSARTRSAPRITPTRRRCSTTPTAGACSSSTRRPPSGCT